MNTTTATRYAKIAQKIQAIANRTEQPFGSKAFISDVYAEFAKTSSLDRPTFDAILLTCHQAGLLTLSRCDLVEAASAETVRSSEVRSLCVASFHLIQQKAA